MALKDFLALVDDKLHETFSFTAPNPEKARKPFLRQIEKAKKGFQEGKQPRGENKWWAANNNVVVFTPNLDGKPVLIGGKDKMAIPSERFVNALDNLVTATNAGELDDAIAGDGSAAGAIVKARGKRGPLSEASLAARRAKVAANKK